MKKKVSLYLEEELVNLIDQKRGLVKRNTWMHEALTRAVKGNVITYENPRRSTRLRSV